MDAIVDPYICVSRIKGALLRFMHYFVLMPLLAPKGLDSIIPGYKRLFTVWSMAALVFIFLYVAIRLFRKRSSTTLPTGMLLYPCVAVTVTALSSDGIGGGLQKLFLYPASLVYIVMLSENGYKQCLSAAAHILCTLFVVQILIPLDLFDFHMSFLGHVQVICQYGLLAFTISLFLLLKQWGSKPLAVGLSILAITCMVTADTDSAHYCLLIFIIVLWIFRLVPCLGNLDFRFVVIASFLFSGFVVALTVAQISPLIGTSVDWTFNGRFHVWTSAWALIQQEPLIGHGVENAVIQTFWSTGMNYAHNQVMQCLLDGGLILLTAMACLLCSVAGLAKKITDLQIRCVSYAILAALLFFMIFDCFTEYVYVYLLLAIIAREGLSSQKELSHGIKLD